MVMIKLDLCPIEVREKERARAKWVSVPNP